MKQRIPSTRRAEQRAAGRQRDKFVAQVRRRLEQTSWRLHLCVIITLAGLAAFLISVAALRLGVSSMALRYPLAVCGGYLAFLGLIRGWIAWQRRALETVRDVAGDLVSSIDPGDVNVPRGSVLSEPSFFSGGRSGGSGGGGTWANASSTGRSTGASSGIDVGLDADELWPVAVAAACALGGLIAVAYVIYTAPVLLAEVALDAAIVSTLYGRLRKQAMSHWAVTVLRRTWVPALVLVAFASIGGYALERAAPEAQSIGSVIRALRD